MRKAFTIIEMIALMVIVAIVAATATPALSALTSSRNCMAGRRLLRDMTFARQRAIATGTRSWVVFDVAGNKWSILVENPANLGRANATALTDLATGSAYVQNLGSGSFVGVTLVSASFDGAAEVGFDWLGRGLNSAESQLAAQGTATISGNHLVHVTPGTGHVRHVLP